MEKSMAQEYEAFKAEAAKVAPLDAEVKRLTALADEQKTKLAEAMRLLSVADAHAQEVAKETSSREEKAKAEFSAVVAKLDAAEKKLALDPFKSVDAGAAKVPAEGGEAKAEKTVDHVAKLNELKGPEKIAYYRANKAAIDATFEVK
jgi:hypothetical protein